MKKLLWIAFLCPLFAYAADVKISISALPAGTTLGGTEAIPLVQSSATVRSTPAAFSTYVKGQITSTDIIGKWTGTCDLTTFLRGDGACSLVGLTTNVTGILPGANGGTANGFFAITGPTTSLKTFTYPNASASVLTTNAVVTVPQGGTGLATLTGLAKGNGASTFSAAVAADVYGLWSGTCSSSTYLRGDGACGTPAGAGTVTSVALTAPSWLAVTGSPVTSSGTLALAAATGQTANTFLATPNGSTGAVSLRAIVAVDLPSISLTSGVTGTLPVANGGTGVTTSTGTGSTVLSTSPTLVTPLLGTPTSATLTNATGLPLTTGVTGILPGANGGTANGFFAISGPATSLKTFAFPNASATVLTTNAAVTVAQGGSGAATLTGVLKGNGTSAFTAAVSSDVYGLWSGTCSSSTFLRGDGACSTPSGSGTVTSVALTMPGVFSVAGSPVTTTGTLAVTASGTSGGIPYFSSSTAMASSAALTAHGVVIGGGAATTPTSTTAGTSGQILTSNGSSADPTFQSGVDITGLPSSTGVVSADLALIYNQSATQTQQATVAQVATAVLGNAFMTFTGPTTSPKTFTLPNASASLLSTNAAVTVAQGGTGAATLTGLLKGNGTSAFTAAAAADVYGLWSGTCSSSTFLRGDGSCQTPGGSGTVTSVAMTVPSFLSISGSPITTSGTLALTLSGTALPVVNGGTGVTTSTGSGNVVLSTSPTLVTPLLGTPTSGVLTNTTGLPLTSGVTGILPGANGGTGNGFFAVSGPATSLKTFTYPNASASVLTDNAAVTVAQGGTGIASGTSGGVPYYSGSTTIASSGALTANALVVGGGAGAAPTTTTTINNGTVVIRVNPRSQTAADATSVTPTGDTADRTTQANTQATGTLTMNAPTGTPVDGQKWAFRIKSTNIQTFSWNAIYRGSTAGALPTTSSGTSLTDYFGFIYNSADSKWDFVSQVKGF